MGSCLSGKYEQTNRWNNDMIFIALYLFYSLVMLFLLGSLTGRILGKILNVPQAQSSLGFVNSTLLGIVTLTTILSLLSIFIPIDTTIHFVILLGLIIYAFIDRQFVLNVAKKSYCEIKENKILVLIGGGWIFAGLVYASGQVTSHDTGLYHAQGVRWINEYGVVPGLGNLHFRLAFNSAWLVFSSVFDILAFDGKSYHLVNLLLFVLGVTICINGFVNIINRNIRVSTILRCLLIFYLYITFVAVPSLSTDFPATTLLLYILILTLELIEKADTEDGNEIQNNRLKFDFLLITIFSCFAVTIKLSVTPILLFLPFLFFFVIKQKNLSLIAAIIFLGICIISPFVVRNLILSGYFVFPVPQASLFTFDWSVPYETTLLMKQDTFYWAIRPMPDYMSVPDMDVVELFKTWFNARIIRNIRFSFLLFLTPILLVPLVLICLNKQKFKNGAYMLMIQAVLIIGVLFWLVSAPDPRLGAGWILSFGLFPIAVIAYYVLVVKFDNRDFGANKYLAYVVLIGFCLWLGKVALSNVAIFGDDTRLIWEVESLPEAELEAVEIHEGLLVHVPQDSNKVWDAQLPTTPYVNYELELRGDSLKDGFRIADP